MIDHHIIFYTSIATAVIALIFANVVIMRYFLNQIKLFKESQDKLLHAFGLMEQAHEVTFEALRATESFLRYVADTYKTFEDKQADMYAKISLLEEKVKDLTDHVKSLENQHMKSDDGR